MRRLALLIAGGAVWLLLAAVPALADNGPHQAGAGAVADTCAGCHRAHTAKAPRLLLETQPALCYTCHGAAGTGASNDVESGIAYTLASRNGSSGTVAGALRGGGFANARIDSAAPTGQTDTENNTAGVIPVKTVGAAVTSTHVVDGTTVTAWGNGALGTAGAGASIQLRCGSCHDPHGNGNYRILRPLPQQSGATAPGVVIADETTKVYTTTNYWSVAAANSASFLTNASAWCTTCHTRYLAGANSAETASGDAIFTYRHRSDVTTAGGPNCVQCHVAHGSNAGQGTFSQAVKNPDGTTATPVTDSRLLRIDNRGVCQMCHNK